MKRFTQSRVARLVVAALPLLATAGVARADVVTDWNMKCGEIITESKLGTPPAIRVMAVVQTAAYEAVSSIARNDPNVSVDAAVAAAHRVALGKLLPAQQPSIDAAYHAALGQVSDGPAKAAGIAAGERAAAVVLAARAKDNVSSAELYRPHAGAGVYVPTAMPAALQWPQRAPWRIANPAQFRPASPPALASATWAHDYDEIRELGARASTRRTAAQTEIGRFWEYSLPAIYFGVVRSVADQPQRDVERNARLFAVTAQAMDDAMIGVFDAKYSYNFWRPMTAIRNGDIDGNDATVRDASWTPLVDAPMHPEYPSAHATLAGAVGAVLKAEIGGGTAPVLATSSPSAKGATRRWSSVEDFVREVGESRIYAGIHYRNSVEVGWTMGRRIGEHAVASMPQAD